MFLHFDHVNCVEDKTKKVHVSCVEDKKKKGLVKKGR